MSETAAKTESKSETAVKTEIVAETKGMVSMNRDKESLDESDEGTLTYPYEMTEVQSQPQPISSQVSQPQPLSSPGLTSQESSQESRA